MPNKVSVVTRSNPWIGYPQENPDAAVRLFCVPYAGSGASAFQLWPNSLPGIEVATVQLPGRETRLAEPPYDRMEPLTVALADAMATQLTKPYAVFGHSMGARIGFELVRELRRRGEYLPLVLFVSGCKAPHIPRVPTPPLNALSERGFVDMLRRINGTPPEIFENPELLELLLPTLRADFSIVDSYEYTDEPALACPVHVFGGTTDGEAREDNLLAWQAHTTSSFRLRMLQGGHFIIQTKRTELIRAIREDLSALGAI